MKSLDTGMSILDIEDRKNLFLSFLPTPVSTGFLDRTLRE